MWANFLGSDSGTHSFLPMLGFRELVACEAVCKQWQTALEDTNAFDNLLKLQEFNGSINTPPVKLLPCERLQQPLYLVALRTLEGFRQHRPPELAAAWGKLSVPISSIPGSIDARVVLTVLKARHCASEALRSGYAVQRSVTPRAPRTEGGSSDRSFGFPQTLSPPTDSNKLVFMTPSAIWLRGWLDFTQHTVLLLAPPVGLTLFFVLLGLRMDSTLQCSYTMIFAVLIFACALVVAVGVQAIVTRGLTERARAALFRAGLLTSRRPGATVLPVYGASVDSLRTALSHEELDWHFMWLPQGDIERRFTVWGMAMWWLVAAVQRHRQYTVWALAAGTVTVFFASPFVLAWQAQGEGGVSWRFAMAPALFVLLAALVWPNIIGSTWGRSSALVRMLYNVVCCPLAVPLLLTLTLSALRLDGADISLETVFMPVWLAAGLITATVLCGGATALITTVQPPATLLPSRAAAPHADAASQGLLDEDIQGGLGNAPPVADGLRERRTPRSVHRAAAARTALQTRYDQAWQSVIIFTIVGSVLLCGLLLSALLLLYRKVAQDEAIAAGGVPRHSEPLWWSTWSFAIFPTWALALCVTVAAAVIRSRVMASQKEWVATQEQRWAERAAFAPGAA